MNPRPVGILGGMGPEATILLQRKLIDAVPARDDADHVPLLIDMNPQVPSRIAHLLDGTGADPGPTLAKMAKRLAAAGAEAIAIPCNTAHHYAMAVRSATDLPFIDMVALSAGKIRAASHDGAPIGILASPAVRKTGIFERALGPRGMTTLWPEDETPILMAIQGIKATGPCPGSRGVLAGASADLAARGATLQVIACSEFSLIAETVHPEAHAIDTLDVLVGAIVDFSLSPTSKVH